MERFIIPLIMFGIPGLILFTGGIQQLVKNLFIKKNGIQTIAKIIDLKIYTDRNYESGPTSTTYPVIEFYEKNGSKIVKELTEGNGKYQRGQRLSIVYIKRYNDYEIITDSKLFLIKFPIGMIVIGFIILSIISFIIINNI
ncbi:hypothetical protein ACJRPK_09985 [Aquimarina sp. 2-A2]|uniref:hypothetical protein n=1 Tax=Aquimarina sp. 2-A2 TaxID=3382644 RepID=UPI00387F11DF